jgi:hypothetical protein
VNRGLIESLQSGDKEDKRVGVEESDADHGDKPTCQNREQPILSS